MSFGNVKSAYGEQVELMCERVDEVLGLSSKVRERRQRITIAYSLAYMFYDVLFYDLDLTFFRIFCFVILSFGCNNVILFIVVVQRCSCSRLIMSSFVSDRHISLIHCRLNQ